MFSNIANLNLLPIDFVINYGKPWKKIATDQYNLSTLAIVKS